MQHFCYMETAFTYSKPVAGKGFIGRKRECAAIANMLGAGESVVLYEPPKTGKHSIISQTLFNMRLAGADFAISEVSLLNVRTLPELVLRIGNAVIKSAGDTADEYAEAIERFLPGTHFIFDPHSFSSRGMAMSLSWDPDDADIEAVLRLPFKVGEATGHRQIVILHEFQNVMCLPEGEKVCTLLADILRGLDTAQRSCGNYILSGSMVNAMKDIFETRRLFRRAAERVELPPITTEELTESMIKGFLLTGKVAEKELMEGVCALFRNNIWYITHFCSICDHLVRGYISEPVLKEALADLLSLHTPRFRAIMSDLTDFQVRLLRAVLDGHDKLSSYDVVEGYGLNSSANVKRIKEALCKKEILTFDAADKPVVLDPLFEYWAAQEYFEIKR